ncbi:response regulator transcription factor [Actinomadura sp. KC216]|nr:response regulator transcription factor [Actinomadura sp. KC216]
MIRAGLTTMFSSLSRVATVHSFDAARGGLHRITDSLVRVLVLSCTDEQESEHARQENRELAMKAASNGIKVLYLLDCTDHAVITEATTLPADGFLLQRELTVDALEDALVRLSQGQMPIPSSLARGLLSQVRNHNSENRSRPVLLTPREHQALTLLAEGLSNKQIARRLGISEHGAKRHVANVLAKMNCPNRTLAVAMALRDGLLTENLPGI